LNDPTIEFAQYIASNHMEMCRFSGHDDADYKKVVTAINRIIKVNIESVHSGSFSTVEENQRQRFLDRLKFDQIEARHATIKAAHAKTCKWLLNKSEYKEWLDDTKNFEHHGFLWLKGKPGTGKSTMMKFAYANAKKCMPDTIVISFFFNARGDDLEKSALGMYRSLLFQLLEKLPDIQNPFELLEPNLPNDFDTDIETAKSVFSRMVDRLGENRLACFIDALDECEEDQARDMVAFFESLGQYAISSHIQMHICFSSRHYPYITIEKGISLVLEDQDGHSKDITDYLHSELKARQNKAMQKVQDEILQRASGVFLWVVLVVKMLNKEFDRGRMHALQKRLDEIPSDLDALFRDILTRDTENVEDLILCLQWILYARRPMKPEELYFAILAGVAAEELAPWNSDELTEQDIQRYILSSSKGLAEMTKSKHPTVQFIHESVRDFLLKGNGLDSLRSHLNKNFPGSSHERLKECCQTYAEVDISEYLSSDTKQPVPSSKEADRTRLLVSAKFPFLEYAVHNVLHHAETADECGISQTYFVHNFPLRDWIHLDNLFEKYQVRRHTPNCSMLYILSEKSLHNLIRIELKRIQNLDIQGERFGFPLHVALANKSEAALRALLLPDTSRWPTDKTSFNCSPSTTNESQNCINLLLEMGNEISSQPDQSVLSWAAKGGHEAIVKLLLDTSKIDIDSKDKAGRTPLLWAAAGGHETIVDLLLKTGEVDVDWRDKAGRTPASWAAAGGYEAVIKLLLGTGKVDVKSEDTAGQTLLLWAAAGGHEIIVRLLLDTGNVDFESKDKSGRTLLSWAAAGGHEVIVKMLLKTGKVNIGSKDKAGWTPASWAAAGRHKAIVKLLLDAREESKIVSQSDRNQPPHLTP
jgi:ankyrin repeat protein